MTYERFLKITTTLKIQDELVSELYGKKIDLIDFMDPYHQVITELIKEVYGETGYEWWSWFCYESDYGTKSYENDTPVYRRNAEGNLEIVKESGRQKWGATDENGDPICYDFLSTWEYLESHYSK